MTGKAVDRGFLDALSEAIVDGRAIDWDEACALVPDLQEEIRCLQNLEALGRAHRVLSESTAPSPSQAPPDGPGLFAWGPLQVLEKIGAGSFGDVHRAWDPRLQREVALKLRRIGQAEDAGEGVSRFLTEARGLARIRHPHVVAVYGTDVHEGRIGFWTELVCGRTLEDDLGRDGPWTPQSAAAVGVVLCQALAAVHAAGLVHGDVKASNVMREDGGRIVLMDLGACSGQALDTAPQAEGARFGTPLVLAPEVLDGATSSTASDLYSLGVLLYQLVTGGYPITAASLDELRAKHNRGERVPLGQLRPDLPVALTEIIERALRRDPGRRYRTTGEMEAALRSFLDAAPSTPGGPAAGGAPGWYGTGRRIPIARDTRVYGRTSELATLQAAYESACAGNGHVVLIEGEAGIGKTRLVDEFVAGLGLEREEGGRRVYHFLFGSFPPGGAATAAGAFRSAYRDHLDGEGLDEALAAHLAASPVLIRPFAALLRGEGSVPTHDPLTRESLETAFVRVAQSLAEEAPVIILIDDLHFAPPEGTALFAALAMATAGHRLLLIGSARPGLSAAWFAGLTRLDNCSRMTVGRLAEQDVARILAEALASDILAGELAAAMAMRSDGNPLFLFEHLRALEDLNVVRRHPGGAWYAAGRIDSMPVPATIRDLIQSRLAALEDGDRELLEVAGCIGFEFDPVLACAAAGFDELVGLRRFAWIERRHRLIRATGLTCVFDHHQVQQALCEAMPAPVRDRIHAAIARSIERRTRAVDTDPRDLEGSVAVALCEHFVLGGQGREGMRYLQRAVEHLGPLCPAAAVRLIDSALAIRDPLPDKDRFDLLAQKAAYQPLLGDPAEEDATVMEMLRVSDRLSLPLPQAQARERLAFLRNRTGRGDEARALLDEAEALARESGDRAQRARIAQGRGSIALHMGRFEEALVAYSGALDLARLAGSRQLEAQVIGAIGVAWLGLRRFGEAERHCREYLALRRADGSRAGEALATGNLGAVLLASERYQDALPLFEEHLRLARMSGSRLGETYATGNLAMVDLASGKAARALARAEQALRLSREIGYRVPEVENLQRLGDIYTLLGRFDDATRHFDQGLAICREINNAQLEGFVLLGLGRLAEESGDAEAALRLCERAAKVWSTKGAGADLAEALLALGWLHAIAGRIETARAHLTDAVARGYAVQSMRVVTIALARLAALPGGDPLPAVERFRDSAARLPAAAKMEIAFHLWCASRDRVYLEDARHTLDDLVLSAPEGDHRRMRSACALHRAVDAASRHLGA